jgi:hypothetical protein
MNLYYGLKSISQAKELAITVCNCLGHGKDGSAYDLILETACAETHLGQYEDPTPNGAGRGLTQLDPVAVTTINEKRTPTAIRDRQKVLKCFDIDVWEVKPKDLDNNPLLALIMCRLHYKQVPDEIPSTVEARAVYWKRYYNTSAGKGTERHYIEQVNRLLK